MQPVVILTLVTYFFSQPDFSNSNNNNNRVRLKKNNKWLQTKQKKETVSNKNNTDWMNKSTTKERTNERNRGKENVYQQHS